MIYVALKLCFKLISFFTLNFAVFYITATNDAIWAGEQEGQKVKKER